MRWLFLFVLLVNIVYVSWEFSQSVDESAVPIAGSNIPTIELLSEVGQATKNPTERPDETVAELTQPSKAAPSKAAPGKSTRQVAITAEARKPPVPATSFVVSKPGADRCFTLGPFRELDNLREFTRAIKNYVTAASFRSREEQEQALFLVYLEPEATIEKAKALGKRLESQKVKDYYVIGSGPHEKGLSLGHFKVKDGAYAHAENVKKLGFKPIVEPVFRTYTIYWLDYQVPASKVIPQSIFAKHLDKKINRLDRSCS